jgi:hypothetical protein
MDCPTSGGRPSAIAIEETARLAKNLGRHAQNVALRASPSPPEFYLEETHQLRGSVNDPSAARTRASGAGS